MRPEIGEGLFGRLSIGEAAQHVADFHVAVGCLFVKPGEPAGLPLRMLRRELIREEMEETRQAWARQDLESFIDGLCDWAYVVLGAYHALGVQDCLGPVARAPFAPSLHFDPFTWCSPLIAQEGLCSIPASIGEMSKLTTNLVSIVSAEPGLRMSRAMFDAAPMCAMVLFDICRLAKIPLAAFFREVHASNMEKAGGPIREDGKNLKPAGWKPPRIGEVLKFIRAKQEEAKQ